MIDFVGSVNTWVYVSSFSKANEVRMLRQKPRSLNELVFRVYLKMIKVMDPGFFVILLMILITFLLPSKFSYLTVLIKNIRFCCDEVEPYMQIEFKSTKLNIRILRGSLINS